MVEVKSVKVDNWGVFFLQKLQNFFNKTDYCDLTLQFNDNSQLKVHRLVLSACTDFFNVLEQTYSSQDDILTMPRDLQADVVVPIVNFMYTGTLEFEVGMYSKLLRTARDMNMTVLLKLLEAHKRTVDVPKIQQQPIVLNKILGNSGSGGSSGSRTYSKSTISNTTLKTLPVIAPQRTYTPRRANQSLQIQKIKTEKLDSLPMKNNDSKSSSVTYVRKHFPDNLQSATGKYSSSGAAAGSSAHTQKGPSRFDCADDTSLTETLDNAFDNISYESKPLQTAHQVIKEEVDIDDSDASRSFEQLRRSYTGSNKRPASNMSSGVSPPEKKPNIQDVKEYTEAHRLRKEIVAQEFNDDDNMLDYDDNFNDDDDDDFIQPTVKTKYNKSNDNSGGAGGDNKDHSTVVIQQNDSSSNVNHAKIISEVLKKYPHLVKNNKNIKLKIMQKGNQQQTSPQNQQQLPKVTIAKTKLHAKPAAAAMAVGVIASASTAATTTTTPTTASSSLTTRNVGQKQSLVPTAPTNTPTNAATNASTNAPANAPKKIDSKTMYALIAKGAENMEGPWLCLKCGVSGRPISIPTYKGFRRHLIGVHNERIDSLICEHCGWRAQKKTNLMHHMLTVHNVKAPASINFPVCKHCNYIALDNPSLNLHMEENHAYMTDNNKGNTQQCIYCNRTFSKEILLYDHMRNKHKERAREDGVMDFSDEEENFDDNDKYVPNNEMGIIQTTSSPENKIKILSNITIPAKGSIQYVIDPLSQTISSIGGPSPSNINLEPSSEAEGLSNVASGIATSLAVLDSNEHHQYEEHHHDGDTSEYITSTQYIDAAMADVHGEYNKGKMLTDPLQIDNNMSSLSDGQQQHVITKFVTEEGSELQLTESQKEELLQQLQGDSGNPITDGIVMVLNQDDFDQHTTHLGGMGAEMTTTAATTSTTNTNTTTTDNNQNILVMYSDGGGGNTMDINKSIITTSGINIMQHQIITSSTSTITNANIITTTTGGDVGDDEVLHTNWEHSISNEQIDDNHDNRLHEHEQKEQEQHQQQQQQEQEHQQEQEQEHEHEQEQEQQQQQDEQEQQLQSQQQGDEEQEENADSIKEENDSLADNENKLKSNQSAELQNLTTEVYAEIDPLDISNEDMGNNKKNIEEEDEEVEARAEENDVGEDHEEEEERKREFKKEKNKQSEDEKTDFASDKNKLITALEGDWSDDELDDSEQNVSKDNGKDDDENIKSKPVKISSINSDEDYDERQEFHKKSKKVDEKEEKEQDEDAAEQNKSTKEIHHLLDDWSEEDTVDDNKNRRESVPGKEAIKETEPKQSSSSAAAAVSSSSTSSSSSSSSTSYQSEYLAKLQKEKHKDKIEIEQKNMDDNENKISDSCSSNDTKKYTNKSKNKGTTKINDQKIKTSIKPQIKRNEIKSVINDWDDDDDDGDNNNDEDDSEKNNERNKVNISEGDGDDGGGSDTTK